MFYVSFSIGIAVWEAPLALTAESVSRQTILYVLSLKRLFIFCLAHFFIICLMQSDSIFSNQIVDHLRRERRIWVDEGSVEVVRSPPCPF